MFYAWKFLQKRNKSFPLNFCWYSLNKWTNWSTRRQFCFHTLSLVTKYKQTKKTFFFVIEPTNEWRMNSWFDATLFKRKSNAAYIRTSKSFSNKPRRKSLMYRGAVTKTQLWGWHLESQLGFWLAWGWEKFAGCLCFGFRLPVNTYAETAAG